MKRSFSDPAETVPRPDSLIVPKPEQTALLFMFFLFWLIERKKKEKKPYRANLNRDIKEQEGGKATECSGKQRL